MSVYGNLKEKYEFPFEPRDFQMEVLERHANDDRYGYYFDPGMGKTFSAILHALHVKETAGVKHWLVLVPPVVIPSFLRAIRAIKDKTGQPLSGQAYYGTPKQRKVLREHWEDFTFIVTSWETFKIDFDYLDDFADANSLGLIPDEAQRQKNIRSQNHKALYYLSEGRPVYLLTGSPTSTPLDSYAYMRFTNPAAYPSYGKFYRTHVVEEDSYGKAQAYRELDLLQENFLQRASRLYKADYLKDLPPVTYNPIFYELDKPHYDLYRRISEEQLVELENGGVLDGTTPSRLTHMLQQVIVNYGHFAGDAGKTSAALDLVEETLDEIGNEKLITVCNYRMSNELVTRSFSKYNPTYIMGGMTHKQREAAIESFSNDKDCRLMVIQPRAAGEGVDGLQHVCSEILFLECPSNPPQFWQTTARVDRSGQTKPVNCRIAVAEKTLQVRRHRQLLQNDTMIASVEGGTQDLRSLIYGD